MDFAPARRQRADGACSPIVGQRGANGFPLEESEGDAFKSLLSISLHFLAAKYNLPMSGPISQFRRLKKRRDFLAARSGVKWVSPGIVVQAYRRLGNCRDNAAPRFGFTVTKRIGNAVTRNRVRRRLREAVREFGMRLACTDVDYVIIARQASIHRPFASLVRDIETGITKVNARLAERRPRTKQA